jgi:UPF0716 family protein affecting phage T7 exclusion
VIALMIAFAVAGIGLMTLRERDTDRSAVQCFAHSMANGLFRAACALVAAATVATMLPGLLAAEYGREKRKFFTREKEMA